MAVNIRQPFVSQPPAIRGSVHIRAERCKGCEACIEFCPTNVLALSSDFNTGGYHYPVVVNGNCICCQSCSTICPEFAIFATIDSAFKDGGEVSPATQDYPQ